MTDIHHELKIEECYYWPVKRGEKTFEIRYNDDRGFQKGDIVKLVPYHNGCIDMALDPIIKEITYVTSYRQKEGFVVFGIKDAR